MRSSIATVRRVSLEFITFCVLLSPMKQLNPFEEFLDFSQVICYSLCWRMIYQILQWYLMSTYSWIYAEYLTQQLLMTYPVSVIWKILFFVNNYLEDLSWQLWFYVTLSILINKIDQLSLCISLCAYFWFKYHELEILLHYYPEMWHHTRDTSTDYFRSSQCGRHPKWMI